MKRSTQIWILEATIFVFALLVMLFIKFLISTPKLNVDDSELAGIEKPINADDPNDIIAAVAYLDKSAIWSKTEMDKYPDLNGLYEAINSYDFDKIIEMGRDPNLQNSANFHSLYQQAMNYKAYVQALTGGGGEHSPKYSLNSGPINLKDYLAHVISVSLAAMSPATTPTQPHSQSAESVPKKINRPVSSHSTKKTKPSPELRVVTGPPQRPATGNGVKPGNTPPKSSRQDETTTPEKTPSSRLSLE